MNLCKFAETMLFSNLTGFSALAARYFGYVVHNCRIVRLDREYYIQITVRHQYTGNGLWSQPPEGRFSRCIPPCSLS